MKCYHIFATKVRQNATKFSSWEFGNNSKCASKVVIETTPLPNSNLKANSFKAPKSNANSLFLIANVQKLKFYKNKGLSLNKHCGVPNTFPTCNLTSELINQDFLTSALD